MVNEGEGFKERSVSEATVFWESRQTRPRALWSPVSRQTGLPGMASSVLGSRSSGLLDCWSAGLPVSRIAGLPDCWSTGLLVCRIAGLPVRRLPSSVPDSVVQKRMVVMPR
jgi:hypothetical protein